MLRLASKDTIASRSLNIMPISLPASSFTLDLRSDMQMLMLPPQRDLREPASSLIKAKRSEANTLMSFLASKETIASISENLTSISLPASSLTMDLRSEKQMLMLPPQRDLREPASSLTKANTSAKNKEMSFLASKDTIESKSENLTLMSFPASNLMMDFKSEKQTWILPPQRDLREPASKSTKANTSAPQRLM